MIGFWLLNIISAFAVSAGATAVILNLVRARAFDKNQRKSVRFKVQRESSLGSSVPLLGILLLPVTLLSTLLVFGADSFWNVECLRTSIITSGINYFFLICALMIIYMVGLSGDFSRVGKATNLTLQLVCAVFIVLSNLEIAYVGTNVALIGELPYSVSAILTLCVVLVTINSVSITIEGFKSGLGKWICFLLILYYGVLLPLEGDYLFSTLAFALLGGIITGCFFFLRNPLYRLGSTGKLTSGLILGILAIRASEQPINGVFGVLEGVISLAPIAILLILAAYSMLKGRCHQETSERKKTD